MKTTQLSKKYSDKELAESFVFRNKLTKKQKEAANKNLMAVRKKVQGQMTPEQILLTHLLQLRFQIEDYASIPTYNNKFSFGHFLKVYLKYLNKKNWEFASDINIHHTELSQIINNRRSPSDRFIIRLEIHSNKTIPAIAWYKLLEKEKEHMIATDSNIRKNESKFVKNKLHLSI
jgi:plasmid maintenance system antidote protein VapI